MESLGLQWPNWCFRPGREPGCAGFDWNLRPQGLQAVGTVRVDMFQESGFGNPASVQVSELGAQRQKLPFME